MRKQDPYPEDFYVRLQNLETWQEFTRREKRRKMITGFCLFFILMLIFTFASRIHYSEKLPQIKWTYPMSSSLKQKLVTSGMISAKSPQPFYGQEGLRISKLCVAEGEEVKAGSILYMVDTEDLQEKLNENSWGCIIQFCF